MDMTFAATIVLAVVAISATVLAILQERRITRLNEAWKKSLETTTQNYEQHLRKLYDEHQARMGKEHCQHD